MGTADLKSLRFRPAHTERVVFDSLGRAGSGVTDPTARLVLKDSVEIRRVGSSSQLLFTILPAPEILGLVVMAVTSTGREAEDVICKWVHTGQPF